MARRRSAGAGAPTGGRAAWDAPEEDAEDEDAGKLAMCGVRCSFGQGPKGESVPCPAMQAPDEQRSTPAAARTGASADIPAGAPRAHWWLDAHLDLAYLDLMGPRITDEVPDSALRGVSLPALRRSGVRLAFGTIFTELGPESATQPWGCRDHLDREGAHAAGVRQLAVYERLEGLGQLRIVRTRADLQACAGGTGTEAPLGLVILMEGADPIRTPDEATWWTRRARRPARWACAGAGLHLAGGDAAPRPLTTAGHAWCSSWTRWASCTMQAI